MSEVKNFAWPVTAVSKEDIKVFTDFLHNVDLKGKRLLIFGAGIRGTILALLARNEGMEVTFTDNNKEKWGGMIDGFSIISPEEAFLRRQDYIFAISVEEGDLIREQLREAGLVENVDFYYLRTDLYNKFKVEYERKTNNKVLMMGDCMFEVISFADTCRDSLSEIIIKTLGQNNVKMLTMHGMSLPSFYHVFKGQINCGSIPKKCVVMINFETLNGKQHLLPRSQHSELARFVSKISPDPDGELKDYAELTESRVKNIQADFFTTNKFSSNKLNSNENGRISDASSKMFLKMNYLYSLDENVEGLIYLRKMFDLSKEHNIELVPFVPPVNYERGLELFGQQFEEKYFSNLDKIKKIISEKGGRLLDLSHICSKELFADVSTPDETTNYRGRCLIADYLCKEVNV